MQAITVGGTAMSQYKKCAVDDETEGVRSKSRKIGAKKFHVVALLSLQKLTYKAPLVLCPGHPGTFCLLLLYCPYAFRVVCVVARQHMFSIHTFMFSMFSLPISGQSVCVDWPRCYNSSLLPPWTITFLDSKPTAQSLEMK